MSILKVPVSSNDHVQGDPNAPVTLVEYGDYECPFCGLAYPIVKALQSQYGSELLFVFRNFPLTQAHPHAHDAAETAEWAGSHNRFWEMHDALYENQRRLGAPLYLSLAETLQLPRTELLSVLQTSAFQPKIQSDFMGGVRSGVNGTPAFFINGVRHDGSYEFHDLLAAIDAHLPMARSAVRRNARDAARGRPSW